MSLADLAAASRDVAATSSRLAKVGRLADALRALAPAEVPAAVAYLSGELRQRQIGVGWAALRELPPPAADASLGITELDARLAEIGSTAGAGSRARRQALLADLFGRATAEEQEFLRPLLAGELRQGALDGVMVDAVARAAAVPVADVRRARMLGGDLREVAVAALTGGIAALADFRLRVGRPLAPMLASPAADLAAALDRLGTAAVEDKVDGVRIQVHRSGADVAIFTRTLDDITARLPEVVAAALALPGSAAVLDGEVVALGADGRPLPFQVTASRVGTRAPGGGSRGGSGGPAGGPALVPVFFDLLHRDGVDLLDAAGAERSAALASTVPADLLVRRAVVADVAAGDAALAGALARGQEGVLVKSLTAPYAAGRRGGDWLKVKPRHTLDLVVLAVEWGHGRRRGWLSNLHLGARGPDGFVMLGKTFKGLTDELLRWQTERLLALESGRDDWTVYVRPELVVEVAFDGVQTSTRYPGGVALRFARVLRYREDKPAAEADTLDTVRALRA